MNTTSVGFDLDVKEKNKIINLKHFTPLGRIKIEKKINSNDMHRILIKKNMFATIKFFLRNPKLKVLDIIYNPNKTVLLQMADIFFIKKFKRFDYEFNAGSFLHLSFQTIL